jgi:hypothetical protein
LVALSMIAAGLWTINIRENYKSCGENERHDVV